MRRVTSVVTPVAHLVGPGKLKVINGRLAFSAAEQLPLRLDPDALRLIYCYGPVGVTDEALQVLFRCQVELAWLTPGGQRCRGRLARAAAAAAPLRLRQYQRFSEPAWRRGFAAAVVAGKVESQLQAARHYQRHNGPPAGEVLQQLRQALERCCQAADLDKLRGVEGAASAAWFAYLGRLLRPPWAFAARTRRPPSDPVNALLSLGYTFLLTRAVARCEALGLEVYLGALHDWRPGRPSLACDLMEPLRVPAVDRWVVEMCNGGALKEEHFTRGAEGVRLQPAVFARMIQGWEARWLSGGHEQTLDALLAQLLAQLQPEPASLSPTADPDANS
jgi:CRISPR-associated endonuclease Cas1